MITATGLTKRYGSTLAVDDLSFEVLPNRVTGFVGPNGAGKSTTLRMVLGLDQPTAGSVTVNGRAYASLRRPLFDVGAMLEGKAIHPGRNARDHLRALAQSNGIATSRVAEVLDIVGLSDVAGRRVGTFSLGMGQRLGIAAALIGDPEVLILDEPVNGLDPDGIIWIRTLLRSLAAQGRTVLLSSHLMSEMALTADQIIVLAHGKLVAESSVNDFVARSSRNFVRVQSTNSDELARLLRASGAEFLVEANGALAVAGTEAHAIGELAGTNGIYLRELSIQNASLEEAFLEATRDHVDYRGTTTSAASELNGSTR